MRYLVPPRLSVGNPSRVSRPRAERLSLPGFDRLEERIALSGPELSISDATIVEGDSGTPYAVFTVSLAGRGNAKAVSVNYATVDGTAIAGTDYATTKGILSFAKFETSKAIVVPILPDLLDENDETFKLVLSGASGATITRATGTGTIVDDDPAPSISVGDAALYEGDAGSSSVTVNVQLYAPSAKPISVSYATAAGTATAGIDFTSTSGVLTFAPGQTIKSFAVSVTGDALNEADETFSVNLSSPVNATIGDGLGVVTILNNDGLPTLSINSQAIGEGNTGTRDMMFTASLSVPSGQTVTVSYATVDGSATAGSDYTAAAGTITFAPGVTTQTVTISVLGDAVVESDETFSVVLSNAVNVWVMAGTGTGTIVNDDIPPPPSISIGDVTVTEGDSGTSSASFTVQLSAASTNLLVVSYATANGTAIAGTDYQSTQGSIFFAPGQTTANVTVSIVGDLVYEPTESFSVVLSNGVVGATIADGVGVATILDNDPAPPSFSIDDAQIVEGNSGTKSLVFHVHLSVAVSTLQWAVVATSDGSAKADSDYIPLGPNGSGVTFLAGVTEQTISIPIIGDLLIEQNETFNATIPRASQAISDGDAVGTIINDDGL